MSLQRSWVVSVGWELCGCCKDGGRKWDCAVVEDTRAEGPE